MAEVAQLWVYLASSPLFGLTATVAIYVAVQAGYERVGHAAWANPVLWSVLCIGAVLLLTHTPYATYFAGAQFVHVLLGPAVVALAWPMWQRRAQMARRWLALAVAALLGGLAAGASAVLLAWGLGLPTELLLSLAPKSVTAPVAMGITERLGGVPALTAVFTLLTGLTGALSAKVLLDLLGLRDWAVRGFALGTVSHGIGAARALQVHPDAGAYAGIALGLQVVLTAVWMPLLVPLWLRLLPG